MNTEGELCCPKKMDMVLPANLLEELNSKVMVWLRDGRTIIGYLRSIDQFANLVLQGSIERLQVGKNYGDIPRGIFLIRGENVALLGDVNYSKEQSELMTKVTISEILHLQALEQEAKKRKEITFVRAFKKQGLSYNPSDNSLELL